MRNLFLVLAIVLASTSLLALHPLGEGGSPEPNTACGSEVSIPMLLPGIPVAGCGSNDVGATVDALEIAAGVVCKICAGGIQCARQLTGTSVFVAVVFGTRQEDGTICIVGVVTNPGFVKVACKGC